MKDERVERRDVRVVDVASIDRSRVVSVSGRDRSRDGLEGAEEEEEQGVVRRERVEGRDEVCVSSGISSMSNESVILTTCVSSPSFSITASVPPTP